MNYLLHENILESATLTASNEATGFEVENCVDKLTSTWWKPGTTGSQSFVAELATSQTVNSVGIIGHNLGTEGATIAIQYSTASPQSWTSLFTITPSDDNSIFRYDATGASAADWRILITNCTAATLIGVVAIGEAMTMPGTMPTPFSPVKYNRNNEILNSVTEGGQFTGRSVISEGYEIDIDQNLVTPAWVDANYDALMDRIEVAPFFFVADYQADASPIVDNSAYCWIESVKPPQHIHGSLYMDFSFKCKAVR
jgi:hypothetical protein